MKKFIVTGRTTTRQISDESYLLHQHNPEVFGVSSGANLLPSFSEPIPNMAPKAIVHPLISPTSVSERLKATSLQHSSNKLVQPRIRPNTTCDPTSLQLLIRKVIDSNPKVLQMFPNKKPNTTQCGEGEYNPYSEVFSDKHPAALVRLPPISTSECLRFAIADAISHQLSINEGIFIKTQPIVIALINSIHTIDQTNPKKYNKKKLILQDNLNQKNNLSSGRYWEVNKLQDA